jgi:hypothetical protein
MADPPSGKNMDEAKNMALLFFMDHLMQVSDIS